MMMVFDIDGRPQNEAVKEYCKRITELAKKEQKDKDADRKNSKEEQD